MITDQNNVFIIGTRYKKSHTLPRTKVKGRKRYEKIQIKFLKLNISTLSPMTPDSVLNILDLSLVYTSHPGAIIAYTTDTASPMELYLQLYWTI